MEGNRLKIIFTDSMDIVLSPVVLEAKEKKALKRFRKTKLKKHHC